MKLWAHWCLLVVVGAVVLGAFPLTGLANKIVRYRGIHPLPPHSGEFCYIDVLHVHAAPPSDMRGYRVLSNQEHVFVGDEAAMGYVGATHAYFGPHPLVVPEVAATEKLFCYLRGAHFHARAPAAGEAFVSKDGTSWYMGTFPPEFERDRFNIWVNDVHPIGGYRPPPATLAVAPPGYHLPPTVEAPPAPIPAPATANAKSALDVTKGKEKTGGRKSVPVAAKGGLR